MSGKQKKDNLKQQRAAWRAKKERDRLESLAKRGRLVDGVHIPEGAVVADVSLQAPNNSYSEVYYYVDIEFTCADCGAQEVWKAQDQKWYYEVAKAPLYAGPKRCRGCRAKVREMKAEQRAQMEAADKARRKRDRESR